MGCCSCKLQCGQYTENEISQVHLKVNPTQIIEDHPSLSPIPEPKLSPIKPEETSTLKPESLSIHSNYKLNSPDISRIELSMTHKTSEDIIQEGDLQKYRPGFTKQFIPRWCVLTSETFKYYKSRGSAQIWGQAPLFCVTLSEIKTVSKYFPFRVNFKIPCTNKSTDQFEIFLKSEDNSVKLSRETDKSPLMRSIIDKVSANNEKDCVVKGMLMKRPLRHDSPEKSDGDLQPLTSERVSWSMREMEWFASEKRLLFIAESALERDFWILNLLKACKQAQTCHN